MYYLGELARKLCASQEVLGSNRVGRKKIFSVRDIWSRFYHPGLKPFAVLHPEWTFCILGSCPCVPTGGKKVSKQYIKHGHNTVNLIDIHKQTCIFIIVSK